MCFCSYSSPCPFFLQPISYNRSTILPASLFTRGDLLSKSVVKSTRSIFFFFTRGKPVRRTHHVRSWDKWRPDDWRFETPVSRVCVCVCEGTGSKEKMLNPRPRFRNSLDAIRRRRFRAATWRRVAVHVDAFAAVFDVTAEQLGWRTLTYTGRYRTICSVCDPSYTSWPPSRNSGPMYLPPSTWSHATPVAHAFG